jgi:parallel beta-helix repeat protein
VPQTLRNNCVYGNELWEENTNYNGLADQTGMNGNISADPKMANYKIGNFHLQTLSPCVDAGYSAAIGEGWTDLDGQARIIGSAVDIGADELQGAVGAAPTPVYYVRPDGNNTQNGLSWAAAKQTVSAAIAVAQATGGEIWVAAGTYVERNILPAFIYLYGGFAGTETDRAGRNITANETILDGGGIPTIVNSLYAGYFLSAIDGFTIQHGGLYTGGGNPGNGGYKGRGAGIYCQVTSPLIQNNIIRHNSLSNPFDDPWRTGYGAGIYTYLSYALIQDNLITENEILSDNSDTGSGGGIYFFRSMPTISRNTISNNRAISGAAIHGRNAYPRIIGNVIENNAFYDDPWQMPGYYMGANEGAITLAMCWDALIERNRIKGNLAATGAGIHMSTQFAGRIQNNLILDNTAEGMGGGIYAEVPTEATSSLYIVNNTIAENTSVIGWGGGIAVSIPPAVVTPPEPIPDRVIIANNIIAFNSSGIFGQLTNPMVPPTLIKNDVYNTGSNYIYISAGATDIHVDPQFVDKPGGDYHLKLTSPCIDSGENSVSDLPEMDLEGEVRIQDGNGDTVPVVDMGALERFGFAYDELGVSFGTVGLYYYNGTTWKKIHAGQPQLMVGLGAGLIADFGSGVGLYRYNGAAWQKMNPNDATAMVAVGNVLYVHFSGVGLYRYDGTWKKIHAGQPQQMLGVGTDLYADFGAGVGLYRYNGTAWQRMNPNDPTDMVAVGIVLYVHFSGVGLYRYDGAWKKIHAGQPQQMLGVGTDLYADFGSGVGLYKHNGTAWQKMNPNDPTDMVAVGNVLYVHFSGVGLYRYDGTWKKIHAGQPQQMLGVGTELYADFGVGVGLYKYNGTAWQRMNPNDPANMVGVNLN